MIDSEQSNSPGVAVQTALPWNWILWVLVFSVLTTALVIPLPPSTPLDDLEYQIDLKVLIGKFLHLGGYAVLTVLTGRLRLSHSRRIMFLFILMAHAAVTEGLQLSFASRTGLVTDVLIDHAGIGLGLVLSWSSWTAPDSK